MKRSLRTAAFLMIMAATPALAQPDSGVTIRSDSLQILERSGDIRFSGSVEVRMEEILLTCDTLTVVADESEPSRVLSGEASGNVVMIRDTDRLEAQTAIFDLEEGKVEFVGAPRLIREDASIEATRIIYVINEGTASFSGPVKALFRGPGDRS